MMGHSSEYWAADKPDWQIGEEIYVGATTVPGFRNMADPAAPTSCNPTQDYNGHRG
jgi:Zn-dependent metalloprotease